MTLDIDKFLQHEVYLQRLASGQLNTVIYPSLAETQKAIRAYLSQFDEIKNITQLNQITKAITEQINSQTGWATVTTNLQEMSLYEAQFQANLLTNGLALKMSLPSDSKIISYINKAIMSLESGQRVDAGTWAQFVQANKDSQAKQINSIVRAAYARGEAMQAISKDIRQSFDGLIKREAETLARTGFAHYAAQANEAMIQDNKDLLKEYYYVVVFDSRTSDICISADLRWNKKRFKVGEKAPTPPLHYNCRTRRIAVPDGWEPKGDKTSIGGVDSTAAEENFAKRKDRKNGGVVKYSGRKDKSFKPKSISASMGYEAWLKQQPDWFVIDTLGKTRADLFISGKMKLSRFTDMTGRTLTLDELKIKGS